MSALRLPSALFLVCAALCLAQSPAPGPSPEPAPMPPDRAADSYAIYSSLMPIGETGNKDWPSTLWIVRNATVTIVPPERPCNPPSPPAPGDFQNPMNPHLAVHPPASRQKDFAEILADFDAHCHDILALDQTLFQTATPVHLLTPAEQQQFRDYRSTRTPSPDLAGRFSGAPALYGFSEVYFNRNHTVALVYATHWCGGLCGQGIWSAFELQHGKWKPLDWRAASWIS